MKLLLRIKWAWDSFWGKKYFIKYTDKLKDDEVLFKGHRIYIGKKVKNVNTNIRNR